MKRFRVVYVGAVLAVGCGGSVRGMELEGTSSEALIFTPRPNFGINFVGGGPNGTPQPMASSEVAGLVPYKFWVNATGATGSQIVPTSTGAATEVQLNWSSSGTFSTGIADTPGNDRLMKGFLNTTNTSTSTVQFTNFPRSGDPGDFGYATADVLVYFDGSNLSADRTGIYNLTSGTLNRTISGKDASGAQFAGTFVTVTTSGGTGNVIRFAKVPLDQTVTITATPGASTDASKRAPINAVQIVPDPEGVRPEASLVPASDGGLIGVNTQGGPFGNGTVFKVMPSGAVTTLHTFVGTGPGAFTAPEGSHPDTRLDIGPDGSLYGTTFSGGSANHGVVYRLTQAGVLTVLHDFVDGADGANPSGRLVVGGDGALYGVTGGFTSLPTVFRVTRDGSSFTTIHTFAEDGSEGFQPSGGLKFLGGVNFMGVCDNFGGPDTNGTIFSLTQSGAFAVLHRFPSTGSGNPSQKLTLAADGKLYGTTQSGPNDAGTVFTTTPAGAFATLFTFPSSGTKGNRPSGEILRASDNTLYGVTELGGANDGGVIFKIANGIVTAPFASLPAGSAPRSGLVQGGDGNFYGTTLVGGGGVGTGTVYRLTPAGALTTIHSF